MRKAVGPGSHFDLALGTMVVHFPILHCPQVLSQAPLEQAYVTYNADAASKGEGLWDMYAALAYDR